MSSATSPRLLVLLSSSLLPMERELLLDDVRAEIRKKLKIEPTLTDSAQWVQDSFGQFGSWESWSHGTVMDKPYGSARLYFDGFVVAVDPVGRANAQLLEIALRHQRVVLQFKDGVLLQVKQLLTKDPNNWKEGWTVQSVLVQETP